MHFVMWYKDNLENIAFGWYLNSHHRNRTRCNACVQSAWVRNTLCNAFLPSKKRFVWMLLKCKCAIKYVAFGQCCNSRTSERKIVKSSWPASRFFSMAAWSAGGSWWKVRTGSPGINGGTSSLSSCSLMLWYSLRLAGATWRGDNREDE